MRGRGGNEVACLCVLPEQDVEVSSRHLAEHLLANPALHVGDTVMLVFLPSLDFIVAFLACLRAGLIAVPVSAAVQCRGLEWSVTFTPGFTHGGLLVPQC
jgi:long-subunit acyl-CoA synthetase (AMP-forming)